MSYSCKILLDSISETGKRITTMEITFPRCVLAEAETHRMFRGFGGNVEELVIHNLGINVDENLSRNSASSRAIPIRKMIDRVLENPFIPEKFGKPVSGMGAKEYWPLDSIEHLNLTMAWKAALHNSICLVEAAKEFGNKEDLNRLLEPFMYHTAIITATEWDNFFKLRTNEAADWKIRRIADLMYEAYHAFDNENVKDLIESQSQSSFNKEWFAIRPQKLKVGEWHCPLVSEEDDELIHKWWAQGAPRHYSIASVEERYNKILGWKKMISVARCARVSYLTHDGKRDIEKDLELFERLRTSGHYSPFEHVATPFYIDTKTSKLSAGYDERKLDMDKSDGWSRANTEDYAINLNSGNFIGWKQFRKDLPNENCISFRKEN